MEQNKSWLSQARALCHLRWKQSKRRNIFPSHANNSQPTVYCLCSHETRHANSRSRLVCPKTSELCVRVYVPGERAQGLTSFSLGFALKAKACTFAQRLTRRVIATSRSCRVSLHERDPRTRRYQDEHVCRLAATLVRLASVCRLGQVERGFTRDGVMRQTCLLGGIRLTRDTKQAISFSVRALQRSCCLKA